MCAVEIVVNAKDIAAIDFMTASIRKDIEESPYRTLKVLCGGFFNNKVKGVKTCQFSL